MHDVIIIGAGCVGSFAGQILAEKGFDVLVIEKDREVGDSVNCSGVIGAEAFERFDLPGEAHQNDLKKLTIFGPSGGAVEIEKKDPFAYMVDRVHFDRLLANRAERSGVTYCLGTFVEDFIVNKDGIQVVAQRGRERLTFRGEVCILATGLRGNKFLSERVGIIDSFVQALQCEAIMLDVKDTEIYLGKKVAPGFFSWLVPAGNGKCKLGLITKQGGGSFLRKFMEHPSIVNRLLSWDGTIKASLIPLGPISKSFGDRVLLMGESAGQTKFTTGGGIYYGLLCAQIGADVLSDAFAKQDFRQNSLAPYEIRWKTLLGNEQKEAKRFLQIISKMSDRQIDVFVRLAQVDGVIRMAHRLFRFDWHAPFISSLMKKKLKEPVAYTNYRE